MDVSGWTIEQRMRFPPWCYGNRLMYNCRMSNIVAGSMTWTISNDPLPDPACIWALGFILWTGDHPWSYWRMGLRSTIPTSEAEMNTCQNIFPDFGNQTFAPPRINVATISGSYYQLPLAYGLVTGGKKFVIEGLLNAAGGNLIFNAYLIVSGLPTSMAGWLAHHKV